MRSVRTTLGYGAMSFIAALVIAPFAWMALSSLKNRREIFTAPFSLPSELSFDSYSRAWAAGVGGYLLNSFVLTLITVILTVGLSALAAYSMARLRFRGSGLLYLIIVIGYAIPVHTVLVPLYLLMDGMNLRNQYLGLILPYIAFGIPFSVLLLYSFFLEFPAELEEAARLDGCSPLRTFIHIVLPLSLPALASAAIFHAVFVWNEFVLALLIVTRQSLMTLPLGLMEFRSDHATDWGAVMAAVTLGSLPLLALYVFFQRYFVRVLAGMSK